MFSQVVGNSVLVRGRTGSEEEVRSVLTAAVEALNLEPLLSVCYRQYGDGQHIANATAREWPDKGDDILTAYFDRHTGYWEVKHDRFPF